MVTGDPLGIYTVRHLLPDVTTIMVTPPIIELPGIEVAPGGRAGEGRRRRNTLEVNVNVSNVRDYAPGDSLRLIHWPTTARRGDLFVKVMDNHPASDWWVFLDLDESVQHGEGSFSTEEHAVILAASIVERGMRSGNAVGLATYGAGLTWRPPRFGEEQRQGIMQELASATQSNISLERLLLHARPIIRENPSMIIVTANLDPKWVNSLHGFLARGIVPTVLLLKPSDYLSQNKPAERVQPILDMLSELGVARYLFPAESFKHPDIFPDVQARRSWFSSAPGKRTPRNNSDIEDWRPV
jgi:uncharacterized protein (DUF58 family)